MLAGSLGMRETQAALVAQSEYKQPSLSFVGITFGTPSYFTLLKFLSWKMHGLAFTSAKPSCPSRVQWRLVGKHIEIPCRVWNKHSTRIILTAHWKNNTDKLCTGFYMPPKIFPEHSCLPEFFLLIAWAFSVWQGGLCQTQLGKGQWRI